MNMRKLLLGVLIIASIPPLIRVFTFVYNHTFADEKTCLRYELRDFHFARFFIVHTKILNKYKGYADASNKFELKFNKEMMKDEGYTDQQIRIIELDAKNAAIESWLKK